MIEISGKSDYSVLLHNIKGIIFDFDGTLFDKALIPFYLIAAYPPDIFRIRKERLVRKRFAGCDYSSTEDYYKAFFTALGKACKYPPKQMQNWYINNYMPRMIQVLKKHYKPRPGLVDFFRRLDIPRIAIYSDYPLVKERIEALGLYPGQEILLYGPESFGAQKPATRPFRQIAGDLGITPEEILVIGDREETDGLGAIRSGMRFFCLKNRKRYSRPNPNRSPPKTEQPHEPLPLMYTGVWDDLIQLLEEKYG